MEDLLCTNCDQDAYDTCKQCSPPKDYCEQCFTIHNCNRFSQGVSTITDDDNEDVGGGGQSASASASTIGIRRAAPGNEPSVTTAAQKCDKRSAESHYCRNENPKSLYASRVPNNERLSVAAHSVKAA